MAARKVPVMCVSSEGLIRVIRSSSAIATLAFIADDLEPALVTLEAFAFSSLSFFFLLHSEALCPFLLQ